MNPLYFGSSAGRLFGIYHPPTQEPARNVGVVICNPFGDELLKAHRALRELSRGLAEARFHVLRFDYFATGDSEGDGPEGTVERWIGDIGTAADELKDMSSVAKISLVGLRFGASLALQAATARRDLDRLALWDPVVYGWDYLADLRQAHATYVGLEFGDHERPARLGEDEIMGFGLTPALEEAIAKFDATAIDLKSVRRAALVVSRHCERFKRLRAHLEAHDVGVRYEHVPVGVNWNADEAMEASLVPKEALRALVEALS
jgi:uncharacterized protein